MTYLPRSNFGRFSTPFAAADIARTGKPGGPVKAPPAPEPRQILLQVKFAALNRVALKQIGFNLFSTSNKGHIKILDNGHQ